MSAVISPAAAQPQQPLTAQSQSQLSQLQSQSSSQHTGPRRESGRRRAAAWLAQGLSIAAFVLLWQGLAASRVHLGLVTFENVPTPLVALEAGRELLQGGKLARHLGFSLWRVGAGY